MDFSFTWIFALPIYSPYSKALFISEVNSSTINTSTQHLEAPSFVTEIQGKRCGKALLLVHKSRYLWLYCVPVECLSLRNSLSNLTLKEPKNLTNVCFVLFLYLWYVGLSNARPGPSYPDHYIIIKSLLSAEEKAEQSVSEWRCMRNSKHPLQVLKMEGGHRDQAIWAASRKWKRLEKDSPR